MTFHIYMDVIIYPLVNSNAGLANTFQWKGPQ